MPLPSFGLQQNPELSTTDWVNLAQTPSDNGSTTTRMVSVNLTGRNTFTVFFNKGSFVSVNNDLLFMVTAT